MSTTQPIRDMKMLHNFKEYYQCAEPNLRNYTLIIVGLNTALRINDLLHLKWEAVLSGNKMKDHIFVIEAKTGKENHIFLNRNAKAALKAYAKSVDTSENPYIFRSAKNPNQPLSRCQAYRIIRKAAEKVGLPEHISCHSLRKTFGYHAWKQGTQPALLMYIFNHSSYGVTRHYLCIEQDDKDQVYSKIKL